MAKESDLLVYRAKFSELNELRNKFWNEYHVIRNQFLLDFRAHADDSDWKEMYVLLNDMYKSGLEEELRRKLKMPPRRDPEFLRSIKYKRCKRDAGLYASETLCVVCNIPLTGRKKLYCSEGCRQKAKSRRWRKENPEAKILSDTKYLMTYYGKDLGE